MRHEPARRVAARAGSWRHGWMLAAAIALIAGAWWLRAPGIRYLVVAAAASVASLILALRLPARGRRWASLSAGVSILFCAIAGVAQHALSRIEHDWSAYRAQLVREGTALLEAEVARSARALRATAARALDASADPRLAFADLDRLLPREGSRGIVLYRGGEPAAWAGRVVAPTASLAAPMSATFTPFYVTLDAVAERGDERAVATEILQAEPPAASLAPGLANRVADRVGLRGFHVFAPGGEEREEATFAFTAGSDTLFLARPLPLGAAEEALLARERARYGGAAAIALALLLFVVAAWRGEQRSVVRLVPLGVALAVLALLPLNAFSAATVLFDPTVYFAALGGAFTASAGALMLASTVVLLGLLLMLRAHAHLPSRGIALAIVLAVMGGGPYLLRALSQGISPPPGGVSTALWLAWEVALFLAAASLLVAAAAAGSAALGGSRGVPPTVAPALAALAALSGPAVLQAPGHWPGWYQLLWIGAIGALALTRPHRHLVLAAASVAALGATTLTWNAGVRGRVALANRDVAGLGVVQPDVAEVLALFADSLARGAPPLTEAQLLRRYVESDLAGTGYPVRVTSWAPDGIPRSTFALAPFDRPPAATSVVRDARVSGERKLRAVLGMPGAFLVLAVPHADGGVTSVTVAPRTRLIQDSPFNALLGLPPRETGAPPYALSLTDVDSTSRLAPGITEWYRAGGELHGHRIVHTARGPELAHIEVELGGVGALIQRGTLVVLLNLALVMGLWLVSAFPDGAFRRWTRGRVRRWAASYRARLTLALFAFFVLPELAFVAWTYRRLQSEDRQSRALLLRETLRSAASSEDLAVNLGGVARRLETPLFVYREGMLSEASDPVYAAVAPIGRLLPGDVQLTLHHSHEVYATHLTWVRGRRTLLGFRGAPDPERGDAVLAAPAHGNEEMLDQRRHDLGVLVLFATVLGALGALGLSGLAARSLALPIGRLRAAALAIAGGEREPPLPGEPPEEFRPVFSAFRHMAADLGESRAALESAQRRTSAVLRDVASGVVAVRPDAAVTLANPRAEALLGRALPADATLDALRLPDLATRVCAFLRGTADEEQFDLVLDGRQLQARLTRLGAGGGGAVLTLDDVTALARAQRVLAWGEMARQVAHEIKNPLTPIRLGVQHLKRAHADARVNFDEILDENVRRILAEIDRLDEIARSFSRYGVAPAERVPAERTDVAAVVRDVVALERLGSGVVEWRLSGADEAMYAMARGDELREVLLNLLENARLASARCVTVRLARNGERVVIEVGDDGIGIPESVIPRIFEPHFSTRTRGTGLGLAISRQLVEGWGGAVAIASVEGEGTTVRVEVRAAGAATHEARRGGVS